MTHTAEKIPKKIKAKSKRFLVENVSVLLFIKDKNFLNSVDVANDNYFFPTIFH